MLTLFCFVFVCLFGFFCKKQKFSGPFYSKSSGSQVVGGLFVGFFFFLPTPASLYKMESGPNVEAPAHHLR